MAIYRQKIVIDNDEAEFIHEALQDWRLMGEDDVITHTAVFNDGIEMDIKCVGCQDEFCEEDNPETGGNQPSWTEAVLFDNGYQVSYSEPDDLYFRCWELEDGNGNVYMVDVVEELITESRVREALCNNIMSFSDTPDMSTACQVGNFWFVVSDDPVKEFSRRTASDDIVGRICDFFRSLRVKDDPKDWYGYCDRFLKECGV